MAKYYVPAKLALESVWPLDAYDISDIAAFDKVWFFPAKVDIDTDAEVLRAETGVLFEEALSIQLPFVAGVGISIGRPDFGTEVPLAATFSNLQDDGSFDAAIAIGPVAAYLNVASDLLVPADKDSSVDPPVFTRREGDTLSVELGELTLSADLDGNVEWTASVAIALPPVFIGDSGVVVEADSIRFYLSENQAPPEGKSQGWKGVVIDGARIYLPEGLSGILPDDIELDDFYIGAGGFCGRITGNWTDADGNSTQAESDLGGMTFKLKSVSIEFKQNTLVDASIKGTLTLPFFNGPVDVEIGLANDGAFTVAIDSADGIASVETDLLTLTLTGLGLGSEAGSFYVELAGTLALGPVAGVDLPDVSVDGLRITSEGKISMEGGGISLESQQTIKLLNAFTVEVDAVAFGSDSIDGVDYNFLSFSGGIQLSQLLPAGVSAKGLQVLWNPADPSDVKLRCEGIGVNFEIKDTLAFDGSVALGDDYFTGAAKLKIIPTDLTVDVGVVIGRNASPEFRYLGLVVDTQLPVGIPLASTGLAFYGFGGLFALNMVPLDNKDQTGFKFDAAMATTSGLAYADGASFHWFNDWYTGWGQPWKAEEGGLGLGTYVVIGTLSDNGFTFASKLAFVLALPGPILMLQGKGNLLKDRAKLGDGNELFQSLVIFDGTSESLLAALGMQYKLPAETKSPVSAGAILDASASSEAFFDFDNASNWHVYLGQEEKEKRIRAEVISLFQADSYLMLDARSFRTGASIGFEKHYDYSVVAVDLSAWLAGDAAITWSPQHMQGAMSFDGKFSVNVAGVGISLSAEAGVAAQTPTPKDLSIDMTVSMDLPWPLEPLEVDVHMAWSEPDAPSPIDPIVEDISVAGTKTTDSWQLTLTAAANDVDFDGMNVKDESGASITLSAIDLDARPVVSFNRPMNDASNIASNGLSGVEDVVNDDYTFAYTLKELRLAKWNDTDKAWQDLSDLVGYWQATSDAAGTQIELYGDGPFSFCRNNISMASGDASLAPSFTPYTDSFLAGVSPADWPLDMTPAEVDFSAMSVTAACGPDFTHEGLSFTALNLSGVKTSFRFSDQSAYADSGIAAPINGDPLGILEVDLGGAAWPKTVRAMVPKGVPGKLVVTGIFADGRTTAPAVFTLQNRGIDFTLPDDFRGVDKLAFGSDKGQPAYLLGFSYLSADQLRAAADMAGDAADLLGTGFSFEPDTVYRIEVVTCTLTNGSGADAAPLYAYFKTEGPPGDLTPYVARAVPQSGTLHYRAYDLVFEFNENYVEEMYRDFDFSVRDENGAAVTNEDGTEVAFVSTDFRAGSPSVAYTTLCWLGALKDMGADPPDPAGAEGDDTFYVTLAADSLLPADKTIDAVFKYDGTQIYSHRFRTSRFAGFPEMIETFSGSPWTVSVEGADLASLNALAGADREGADFETAWYTHLAQQPKALPGSLEVSKLDRSDGTVLGLYIEFPEAVDWGRGELSGACGTSAAAYRCIGSYDGARAVLLDQGGGSEPAAWAAGDYTVSFRYRLDLEDDAYPVLYRYGSPDDEVAAVTFTI